MLLRVLLYIKRDTDKRPNTLDLGGMDSCQAGFHDSRLQSPLEKFVLPVNISVNLCDSCSRKVIDAQNKKADLTMEILYYWGIEYDEKPHLPAELKKDGLKTAKIVQFVNNELGNMRIRNQNFPIFLLYANEKDEFSSALIKDSSLEYVSSYAERKSIYLRAWSGCLEASKALREKYVAERNVNGSTKREEVFTAKMREEEVQIAKIHDPIYEAGVKAAVLWELKVIGFSGKKTYLDGVPKQSVGWNYIKDNNKKIISEDDIETTNENTQD
jgi:hypothetical protein